MKYLLDRTVLFNGEFTPVVIGSAVLLIGVAVYCILRERRMKKERDGLRGSAGK